jgi:hypothetical protein
VARKKEIYFIKENNMKILDELKIEIDRLIIAGSRFAIDDPRIKKFIPTFEKLGEKSPVMKKIAVLLIELAGTNPDESPDVLMKTGTFLYSVIYTQGVSVPADMTVGTDTSPTNMTVGTDTSPADSADNSGGVPTDSADNSGGVQTDSADSHGGKKSALYINNIPDVQLPYSKLTPIVFALTEAKQFRMAAIEQAYKEKIYDDFRMYSLYANALDDKNSEMAQFVSDKIIPAVGENMIPFLLDTFDMQGGIANARRLSLMKTLGYDGIDELVDECMNSNCSDKVMAVCILLLSNRKENEQYLLDLTKDKKAAYREAAYTSLVMMGSESGMEKMLECLNSAKYKNAIQAAERCTDEDVNDKIIDIIAECYEVYVKHIGSSKDKQIIARMKTMLEILRFKTTPKAYEFITRLSLNLDNLSVKDYSEDVKETMLSIHVSIHNRNLDSDFEFYENLYSEKYKDITAFKIIYATYYFSLATKRYYKEQIYDAFSGIYIKDKNWLFDKYNFLFDKCGYDRLYSIATFVIDERWCELFIEKKDLENIGLATRQKEYLSEKAYKSMWEFLRNRVKKSEYFNEHDSEVAMTVFRYMIYSNDKDEYAENADVILKFFNDYLDKSPDCNMLYMLSMKFGETKASRLFAEPKYIPEFEKINEKIENLDTKNITQRFKDLCKNFVSKIIENIKELTENGK